MKFHVEFTEENEELKAEFGSTTPIPDGQNGATFTPSVSADGVISWSNDRELPNPQPVNIKGPAGTSVTVESVSESTADGGSNVVTFSDGKTVTIKNGKQGNPGYTPQKNVDYFDGKTPVKGTDYFTEADKAEMVSAVIAALPDASEVSY